MLDLGTQQRDLRNNGRWPTHPCLSRSFLKWWKQTVSRQLKGSREQFWQDRYFDVNIRGPEARSETIRYIHRNSVKRGLVTQPEEYRWSSFRHYLTGERGPVEIESEWTANYRQKSHSS